MNTNEYYENVRREIALDYGLEAGGYAPVPAPALSTKQALYLMHKYPNTDVFAGASDKAMAIAKRYGSLVRVMKVTR